MLNKEEIEKAKEYIEGLINLFYEFPNPQSVLLEDNKVKYVETLLQYIDQLENQIQAKEMEHEYDVNMIDEVKGNSVKLYKEIRKQNKIIDEMAEHIVSSAIVDDTVCSRIFCEVQEDCSHEKMLNCTKQYFEKKVEGK